MEITQKKQAAGWVELRVTGRLDSYWADHFKTALTELIRAGTQKIRLNLAEIRYLSSAGVGALIWCHKQLEGIRGKLMVVNPSEPVKEVLELTRLTLLLGIADAAAPVGVTTTVGMGRTVFRGEVTFEVFGRQPGTGLTCRLLGSPDRLFEGGFGPDDCRAFQFPATALGVGLGALGRAFADCQDRFGEFLAAAGAVAYLPTDGTNVPDYLVAAGESVPELQVCYGLVCDGGPLRFTRFEPDDASGRVPFSTLVRGCLDLAASDQIGLVILGETAGLMGAALRRPPVVGAVKEGAFTFPQVRDWLTYTAERAYGRSMALAVGVAGRGDPGPLAPLVRPLGKEPSPWGHCHAAAFSYRPVARGELDLRPTVAALFEQQTLLGILHLLADHRATLGMGESEFVRGVCWFGPLGGVAENGS
jgi:anti-anti-sigma factor